MCTAEHGAYHGFGTWVISNWKFSSNLLEGGVQNIRTQDNKSLCKHKLGCADAKTYEISKSLSDRTVSPRTHNCQDNKMTFKRGWGDRTVWSKETGNSSGRGGSTRAIIVAKRRIKHQLRAENNYNTHIIASPTVYEVDSQSVCQSDVHLYTVQQNQCRVGAKEDNVREEVRVQGLEEGGEAREQRDGAGDDRVEDQEEGGMHVNNVTEGDKREKVVKGESGKC